MNKKIWIFIAIIGGIFVALMSYVAWMSYQGSEKMKQDGQLTPVPKTNSAANTTKTYNDASGISFSYPEDILVTTQEATDEATYTIIELSSDEEEGKITITAVDTKLTKVADLFKEDLAETTVSATLASLEGLTKENKTSLYTAAIDQGILFSVITDWEDDTQKKYWSPVHEKVISSFAFVQAPVESAPESAESGADYSEEEIIFEGEEIIE